MKIYSLEKKLIKGPPLNICFDKEVPTKTGLGFAKKHDIQGIGMYGEINQPEVPQYRAAISIIKTIEKLTYRKLGNTEELESLAQEMDQKFRN